MRTLFKVILCKSTSSGRAACPPRWQPPFSASANPTPQCGHSKVTSEGEEDAKPEVEVKAGERRGVWAVSTEFDKDGHMWTAHGPDAIVARRVQAVARASWAALQEMESADFDAKVSLSRTGLRCDADSCAPDALCPSHGAL